jgi:protocatechuate 3,4-dioxygenase beta subunit
MCQNHASRFHFEADCMTMRCIAPVLLTIALTASATAANAQQIFIEAQSSEPLMVPPGLGGPRQIKTGTGRILGRVLASDNGAPIRRAQVRLTAPEIGVKTALTDADGRFEFRELPAGRFTLNASKSGYVAVQYGQTRPFEQGRPIELAEKQVLDKADISMPRGGVITGRLTDEFGDPVPDAMVSAMRQTWTNGRRRLTPSGRTSQTNDLGQYRMYGLPPGEYYISATLRNTDIMMLDAAMMGGGSNASGSTPSSGYAPTYFPGTTTASNAQRVTVAIAQEAQNTDFALAPVRLARISGTVMNSEGKPVAGAMITAMPSSRAEVGIGILNAGNARTTKDGNFTLNSVAPGDYMVTVRSVTVMTSDGGDMMTFRASIGGDGSDGEAASLPLTVSGEDMANVVIVTSKGATASGRLVFEGSANPPAMPTMTGVRITAASAEMDGPALGGGGAGQAKEDGSFQLRGLAGRRLLRAANLPPGWALKAVRLNGDDITDSGIEFKPGQDVSGLEIVATSKQTEISGTVTASNGSAIKDYTVVVFSDDSQYWSLPLTRWVTGTRPDQEGRFRVRNMPPGSYNIIAVDYVEAGSWGDPELLERLKARARRVTLADGGSEKLDLKLTETY